MGMWGREHGADRKWWDTRLGQSSLLRSNLQVAKQISGTWIVHHIRVTDKWQGGLAMV